jgi:hypothetical protein
MWGPVFNLFVTSGKVFSTGKLKKKKNHSSFSFSNHFYKRNQDYKKQRKTQPVHLLLV